MLLFIRAANPIYPGILKNGPFIPLTLVLKITSGSEVFPTTWAPKDPSYTQIQKKKKFHWIVV